MAITKTASLNTKMDQEMRDRFMQIADNLGVSASGAVRVFVNKFIECGGFPFDVREHSKA